MKLLHLPAALRIALLYLLFGGGWILLSDHLLAALARDVATLTRLQTVKGWAFVLVSALLIYHLVHSSLHSMRQTEAELRQSEERYRQLFSNSMDAILLTAPDGSIFAANPAACALFGRTEQEIQRIGRAGLMAKTDARWQAALTERARTGRFRGELTFRREDGAPFESEISTTLFQNREGQARSNMIIRDITARIQAEQAQRESERRLHFALQKSHTGGWDLDLVDHTAHRTLEHDRIFGYESLLPLWTYEMFLDHVLPEDQAEVDRQFQAAVAAGADWNFECRIRRRDGVVRWIWAAGEHQPGENGQARRMAGIVQDITARKEGEEALRRRADEFATLYDIAHDLIIQGDLPALLETVAQRTARLLGAADATIYLYDPRRDELELAAANVYALSRGARFKVDGGVTSQVVRTRRPATVADYRRWTQQRPELAHLDLRAVIAAPLIYQEEMIGVLGVAEIGSDRQFTSADVRLLELLAAQVAVAIQNVRLREALTAYNWELEKRVAERTQQLEEARTRAESADRVKSAFLATMSHELRTPLNSIIGFTGVLLQGLAGPLNAEQSKQMGMARDSARHLLALINDVLDISKIEAGQLEMQRAPFDMRAAIEAALKLVLPQAQKKGLSLAAAIGANVGEVVSDRRRVEQILLNLLSNAVKFTERGEVRLECRARAGFIETSVHDTGIGIRAEDVEKLFAPFRQIEMGLNRRHEGTGLGLSICKNLVEMLGGEIRVASEWGRGSVFTFTLPLEKT